MFLSAPFPSHRSAQEKRQWENRGRSVRLHPLSDSRIKGLQSYRPQTPYLPEISTKAAVEPLASAPSPPAARSNPHCLHLDGVPNAPSNQFRFSCPSETGGASWPSGSSVLPPPDLASFLAPFEACKNALKAPRPGREKLGF